MNNTTDQSKFTKKDVRLQHQEARNNAYWGIKKQGNLIYKKLKYLTHYELMIAKESIKKTQATVKDPNLTINGILPNVFIKLIEDEFNYRIYREECIVHSILESLEITFYSLSNANTKPASQSIYSENYIPKKQLQSLKLN
jgi:hypothetical protein